MCPNHVRALPFRYGWPTASPPRSTALLWHFARRRNTSALTCAIWRLRRTMILVLGPVCLLLPMRPDIAEPCFGDRDQAPQRRTCTTRHAHARRRHKRRSRPSGPTPPFSVERDAYMWTLRLTNSSKGSGELALTDCSAPPITGMYDWFTYGEITSPGL